jgi:hypothetical protein
MHLKLKWARFFALAGWAWKLAPKHSSFDFRVTFPCEHSECNGSHSLLVRISEKTLEALTAKHADLWNIDFVYSVPSPALFGDGPNNTYWQMVHGAGGGDESVSQWLPDANERWERASHE